MMSLAEFELHRPSLGRMLRAIAEDNDLPTDGWRIKPRYDNNVLFTATFFDRSISCDIGLTCVGPAHPRAMVEEGGPEARGTWWWNDDLNEEER